MFFFCFFLLKPGRPRDEVLEFKLEKPNTGRRRGTPLGPIWPAPEQSGPIRRGLYLKPRQTEPGGVLLGDPCWGTIGLQRTPGGFLIRRISSANVLSQGRRTSPGGPPQPSKSPVLAEVPSLRGPVRISAKPVLGVGGKKCQPYSAPSAMPRREIGTSSSPTSLYACRVGPGTV